MLKQKFLPIFLALMTIIGLFHSISLTPYASEVSISTEEELKNAIGSALVNEETIININSDIIINSTISIPTGSNITLKGNGGNISIAENVNAAFTVSEANADVNLSFADLNVQDYSTPSSYSTTKRYIFKGSTNSALKIIGKSIVSTDAFIITNYVTTKPDSFKDKPSLYIYGGNIKGRLNSSNTHLLYLCPRSLISIEGKWSSEINCVVQDGVTITNAIIDNETITNEFNNGTVENPYSIPAKSDSTHTISITVDAGSISTSTELKVGEDKDIVNKTGSTGADVTGKVTDGTATLNVACDKACTVAYTTDNGATYTRVDAVQADSGYNFEVSNYTEGMKFVVAVKGDLDGDGLVNLDDMAVIASANLSASHQFHEDLSALNLCLGDLDGDGIVNLDDMAAIASANLSPTHQFYEAINW